MAIAVEVLAEGRFQRFERRARGGDRTERARDIGAAAVDGPDRELSGGRVLPRHIITTARRHSANRRPRAELACRHGGAVVGQLRACRGAMRKQIVVVSVQDQIRRTIGLHHGRVEKRDRRRIDGRLAARRAAEVAEREGRLRRAGNRSGRREDERVEFARHGRSRAGQRIVAAGAAQSRAAQGSGDPGQRDRQRLVRAAGIDVADRDAGERIDRGPRLDRRMRTGDRRHRRHLVGHGGRGVRHLRGGGHA